MTKYMDLPEADDTFDLVWTRGRAHQRIWRQGRSRHSLRVVLNEWADGSVTVRLIKGDARYAGSKIFTVVEGPTRDEVVELISRVKA
jgi:hypothetical protein